MWHVISHRNKLSSSNRSSSVIISTLAAAEGWKTGVRKSVLHLSASQSGSTVMDNSPSATLGSSLNLQCSLFLRASYKVAYEPYPIVVHKHKIVPESFHVMLCLFSLEILCIIRKSKTRQVSETFGCFFSWASAVGPGSVTSTSQRQNPVSF